MADSLTCRLTERRQSRRRDVGITLQQLLSRPPEPEKRRTVDAIGEITPNRADRRSVPDSKAHCMNHIVEVFEIALLETERHVAYSAVHVAHIVEQHSLHVFPEKR